MNLEGYDPEYIVYASAWTTADKWIFSRLNATIRTVNAAMSTYDMDDASRAIYQFFWNDFCDWYLELAKPRLRSEDDRLTGQKLMARVFEITLRLMHPIIPFITEEVWQALPKSESADGGGPQSETICLATFPEPFDLWDDPVAEAEMALMTETIRAVRNIRAELGIAPGVKLKAGIQTDDAGNDTAYQNNAALIAELAKLESFAIWFREPAADHTGEGKWVGTPLGWGELYLNIGETVDMSKELERIEKELTAIAKQIERAEGMLNNPSFVERATPEKVEEERKRLADWQEKQTKLDGTQTAVSGITSRA